MNALPDRPQNAKPPGLPFLLAISPATVAIAISAGVREPMFRPTGRCTWLICSSGTPSAASAGMCGARDTRVAHDADPPGPAVQGITEHDPEFRPVMIGDHHVSRPCREGHQGGLHHNAGFGSGAGAVQVRLHQHGAVAGVAAVPEQVNRRPVRRRRRPAPAVRLLWRAGRRGAVRHVAGRVVACELVVMLCCACAVPGAVFAGHPLSLPCAGRPRHAQRSLASKYFAARRRAAGPAACAAAALPRPAARR